MNRIKKVQNICKNAEVDAVMVTGEINRFYATRLHTSDGVLILSSDRAIFVTDSRYIEIARQTLTDCQVEETTYERDYHAIVGDALRDWGVKKLGFEDAVRTVKSHNGWTKKHENIEWTPISKYFDDIRAVKEPCEIEMMVAAQRIAERALDAVLKLVKPGITERELATEVICHILRFGADDISFQPIVVAGPNSSKPHGEPGDRPLQSGDFVTFDIGAKYRGYCSDMTRTVVLGHATDEMRRVYETVLRAQIAGISAVLPGVVGSDVHAAAAKVIDDAGYGKYFGHGFGHGLGLEVHEGYGAYPRETRKLPENAVISAEPGIYLPEKFGVRIEDCIVVKQGKAENLMNFTKNLIEIPV